MIEKKALTPREVAQVYGLDEGTLANFRWKRTGPRYYKIGRKVLYMIGDVESWVRRSPCLTTDSVPEKL